MGTKKHTARLDREIKGCLTRLIATPYNIAVLAELAHGRREFPNAIGAAQSSHVQRSLRAGLVEIVGKRRGRQAGDRMRITPFGYEAILDLMATDPYYGDRLLAPIGDYTASEYRRITIAMPETTTTPTRRG